MATWCLTQARARETAAKPPSTTSTSRLPGRQRRTRCIICRTHSTPVWCRRRPLGSAGQHHADRKGNAHTRCAHGTGPNSLIDTHFRPKQCMTWGLLDRTASRSHPLAVTFRPWRRSPVSAAPRTIVAPGGTKPVMSNPSRIRLAWRAAHGARFRTRWSLAQWRSVANPITRKAAGAVRALGATIAPKSHTGAWPQTRSEKRGANGAKTRMIASGRAGGMAWPPSRA
jgi:hypothetical protein